MSTPGDRRDVVAAAVALLAVMVALAVLVVLGTVLVLRDQPGPLAGQVPRGQVPGEQPPAGEEAEPGDSSRAATAPQVVSWGGQGRHLAVLVRNRSHHEVRRGLVRLTVLDESGRTLVATTGRPGSKCCTILGLGPDGLYALYLDLDHPVSHVGDVTASYAELSTTRPRDARVRVTDAELVRTAEDTVVTATFTTHDADSPYVVGQAVLVDRRGRMVAVMSGRYYCFTDGIARPVELHLYRPVPAGTRVSRVLAHSVPAGVSATVQPVQPVQPRCT